MTLKNLKIIIVDEVSMVSNLNLAYLHMRLEDIFGTEEWFGSKNILFVGDLLLLPPVNGTVDCVSLAHRSALLKINYYWL